MGEHIDTFVECLGCKDGRTIDPIQHWARKTYGVTQVDFDTEPGMDLFLSSCSKGEQEKLKKKVLITIEQHLGRVILVAGHCECVGNPVSAEEHRQHITKACEVVRSWDLPEGIKIIGLLVNGDGTWQVEVVSPADPASGYN